MGPVPRLGLILLAATFLAPTARAAGDAAPKPRKKELEWLTSYPAAAVQAHKTNRLILAYFTGSDWSEWDHKLNDEVLSTDAFHDWADQNVIPLKVDFPRDKPLNANIKEQNDKLKDKYNVGKVPTLIFLDPDGEIVARAGYDEAKLRENEKQGHPDLWLKFCADAVKNRPPDETIIEQKGLIEGMAYAKKHYLCLLVLVSKSNSSFYVRKKEELLKSQPFVRFVNRNMAFVQMDWPDDADVSAEATAWRQFADKFKIGSSPIQLIFWDFGLDKVQARVTGFDSQQTDSLIEQLSRQLPHPDYTGEWLTDFRTAQAIAAVQKKPVFIFFTSMDSSEYCQAFESEIIKTDEFTAYSRKYLVLVKVDFPQHSQLSDALKDQNRRLADLYGIRGYPTIILLNSDGHRIGDAKYQKGGPVPFLTELESVVKMDKQRRTPTP